MQHIHFIRKWWHTHGLEVENGEVFVVDTTLFCGKEVSTIVV